MRNGSSKEKIVSRRLRAVHLAYIVRPTILHRFIGPALERISEHDWNKYGEGPAPASVKHRLIRRYAKAHGIKLFIETGTFLGDMIEAVRGNFDEIHSIELDVKLHKRAKRRFAGAQNVHLHQGDSGRELPKLVAKLNQRVLFWLDAHWSRGVTARGDLDTPINSELDAILEKDTVESVILIDDARLFGTAKDYPTVSQIREAVTAKRPDWDVIVSEDVIHVGPRALLLAN